MMKAAQSDKPELRLSIDRARAAKLADLGIRVEMVIGGVDEKDWADAWKADFNVTRIKDGIQRLVN